MVSANTIWQKSLKNNRARNSRLKIATFRGSAFLPKPSNTRDETAWAKDICHEEDFLVRAHVLKIYLQLTNMCFVWEIAQLYSLSDLIKLATPCASLISSKISAKSPSVCLMQQLLTKDMVLTWYFNTNPYWLIFGWFLRLQKNAEISRKSVNIIKFWVENNFFL